MYSPGNNNRFYRVSSVLLCLFLLFIPQPALGRPAASPGTGMEETREHAEKEMLSMSVTQNTPSALDATPVPLPRFCDGVTPPGATPPPCCVFGYAYHNDEPAGGVSIRIESPHGFVEIATQNGGASTHPYYGADLSSAPLSTLPGEVITITASYDDMISIRTWTVQSDGQQVDIGLVDGYRATGPLAANGVESAVVRPTDVRPLSGTGVPFDSAAVITNALWNPRSTYASDLDNDGDLDILSASIDDDKIVWYENDGGPSPTFTSHLITDAADGASSVYAADLDRDGDVDVLSASLHADQIAWYENDGGYPPSFTTHVITNNADEAVSVYAADLDDDGDMDVVSASRADDTVAWYENDGSSPPAFTAHTITTGADLVTSVYAADLDGDGDLDVLSASRNDNTIAWYENGGGLSPVFTAHTITIEAHGARSIHAVDVDRDGDVDVLAAALNDRAIVWYENNGGTPLTFTPHIIVVHSILEAAAVYAADADHDGDVDVLAGFRSDTSTGQVVWYENDGSASPVFTAHLVADDVSDAVSVSAADIDGDGDADILSVKILDGTANDQIVWYENQTIHRSAAFPIQSTISDMALGTQSVYAADMDHDGDIDALSASAGDDRISWYENSGSLPLVFTPHTVATGVNGARSVYAADIDDDGDMDVLSASTDDRRIAWYENNGSSPPNFVRHVIATTLSSAVSVHTADLDDDGDVDVLSASRGESNNAITWYENNGGSPPGFASHTITNSVLGPWHIYAEDIDQDGDIDVLSASNDSVVGSGNDRVIWYENDGSTLPTFTGHIVDTAAQFPSGVYAADLDRDGDIDLLSSSWQDDAISWYENDGSSPPAFTKHVITTYANGAWSVLARDLDLDGDLDILSASFFDDKIAWYENDGGQSPVFAEHVITRSADQAFAVYAQDIDGDGDIDVLSASAGDDSIAWYENQGFQFALSAADTAPFSILIGQQDDVLKIVAEHRGRVGDTDVELVSFNLLFEDIMGNPLSTIQANSSLENLYIYRDDNSGHFELLTDTLVTTVGTFVLVAGTQTVSFADQDPNVRLSVGSPMTYFVTAEFKDDAARQIPNQFRITHLAGQDDTAQDWDHGLSLAPEFGPNGASRTCSAPTMYHHEYAVPFGTGTDGTFALAWGDADNDGYLDLAVGNQGQNQICWNNGGQSFDCESAFGASGTYDVDWGDMNQDGYLDLVVGNFLGNSNRIFINNGNRTFTLHEFSWCTGGQTSCHIALADIDDDGDLDIALGNQKNTDLVYYNDGNGVTFSTIVPTCYDGATQDMEFGDVDNDDDQDLVVVGHSSDFVCINNSGVLNETRYLASRIDNGTWGVALGDADGDGDIDIAAGEGNDHQNEIYLNDGNGYFTETILFGPIWDITSDLTWGDVDGDGDLDLASGNAYLQTRVYFNEPISATNSITFVQSGFLSTGSHGIGSVAFADMDNDGDQDLAEGSDGDQNVVFLNANSPLAEFSSSNLNCGLPLGVQFVDRSTGRLVSWTWDFGDGEIDGARHPFHIYWESGVYTVTLTVAGPDGTDIETKSGYVDASAGKNWTFMLYFAGDNNLDRWMQLALRKLERVMAYANVRVLVLVDGRGSNDTRRYDVQPYGNYTDGVNRWQLGELNTGDPQTLSSFVTWAYDNYPADYYYLAVANHGRGTTGIAWDDTSGSDMISARELETALQSATENGARPIDVVHYDACLMAMLENAYQIRNFTDYFVASQNLGWSVFAYDRYATFGCMMPEQLAIAIVDSYHNATASFPHTISALDLEHIYTLKSAVNTLAVTLTADMATYTDVISNTWRQTQKFDSRSYFEITDADEYLDLYHLAALLNQNASDCAVKNSSQDVMDAIDSCVIAEHHRSGSYLRYPHWDLDNAHGVSIYFPPSCGGWGYQDYRNDFRFGADSQWDEFLQAYCDANAELPPPQPLDPGVPPILKGHLIYLPMVFKHR